MQKIRWKIPSIYHLLFAYLFGRTSALALDMKLDIGNFPACSLRCPISVCLQYTKILRIILK